MSIGESGARTVRGCLLVALLFGLGAGVAAEGARAAEPVAGPGDEADAGLASLFGAWRRDRRAGPDPLQVQVGSSDDFEAAPEYWSDLAELQLSLGMPERADDLARRISTAAKPMVAARARLRLAKFEYENGELDAAQANLARAHETLPRNLVPDWAGLYARVLMAQGRYGEAVKVLDPLDVRDDSAGFLRYNLGIALILNGRLADGRVMLDRVGRIEGDSETAAALRDQANVTLGWHFLRHGLGGAARPLLMRVRLEGPYANRALLGLGWTELAPAGSLESRTDLGIAPLSSSNLRSDVRDQISNENVLGVLLRRAPLDDPDDNRGQRALIYRILRRGSAETEKQKAQRRALVAWVELLDRDPQDPAVQEAWLAVPFVLDKLGAHADAARYYEQAVQRLEAARGRTARAITAIESECLADTLARAESDPQAGAPRPIQAQPELAEKTDCPQSLIAEHPFAEALNHYGDLGVLARGLESWRARLARMEAAAPEAAAAAMPGANESGGDAAATAPPRADSTSLDPSRARLQVLDQRLDELSPLLARARAEAAAKISGFALSELGAQKTRIDKDLFEARFALARRYEQAVSPAIPGRKDFEIQNDSGAADRPAPDDFKLAKDRP